MSYVDTPGPASVGTRGLLIQPEAPPAVLAGLPPGRDGTIATLRHMKTFVLAAIRDPNQVIRNVALDILKAGNVPPRAYGKEILALHRFVRDQIRYVKDPVGVELVQAPQRTLEIGQGDCDDKSTLLAALLMATGHPAAFKAVGFRGNGFSHVLVIVRKKDKWIPLESILPKPAGWFPPGVTSQYTLNL